MAPAVSQSPASSASAGVIHGEGGDIIYEDEGGSVIECSFHVICRYHLSRSSVKILAFDYSNEVDITQGVAFAIICMAVTKPGLNVLCDAVLNYLMNEFVRDEIRQAANEGKCVRIETVLNVPIGISRHDGEYCRD
jgi:hypothetical protein